VSFLISLLLPILATVILFQGYPERAARGQVPPQLTAAWALTRGALAGAAALVFLGILGVLILAYRRSAVTPTELGISPLAFWSIQFLLTAAIGAGVGALSALVLLPWARRRLARHAPTRVPPLE
jgi:hypothetical protein